MEQKILNRLVIVNFILSLLIVFHHAFTLDIQYVGTFNLSSYGIDTAFQRYMYNLSECAVPIFYFLSAYLFFRMFDGSLEQYRKKLYRRFFSLFIPYVIFCTLGYIKHIFASGLLTNGNLTLWGGVIYWLSELCLCQTMPLWFIRELMFLVLLTPCFYELKKHKTLSYIIVLLIVLLVTIGFVHYRSFAYWIPVYMLGVNLKKNWWNDIHHIVTKYNSVFITIIGLYIIGCWFLPNGTENSSYLNNFIFIIFRIITPICFIPLLVYITNSNYKVYKWMNYSFFVYCMHFPIITILSLIFEKISIPLVHSESFKYIIIVVLTYSLCVIMAMFMEHFMPKIWMVINGRRK